MNEMGENKDWAKVLTDQYNRLSIIESHDKACKIYSILTEVGVERAMQDVKWGEQNHSPADWLMILMEEVGEASKAALEHKFEHMGGGSLNEYRKELIQVAAVAVQMIESLDRNELGGK